MLHTHTIHVSIFNFIRVTCSAFWAAGSFAELWNKNRKSTLELVMEPMLPCVAKSSKTKEGLKRKNRAKSQIIFFKTSNIRLKVSLHLSYSFWASKVSIGKRKKHPREVPRYLQIFCSLSEKIVVLKIYKIMKPLRKYESMEDEFPPAPHIRVSLVS